MFYLNSILNKRPKICDKINDVGYFKISILSNCTINIVSYFYFNISDKI